MEPAAPSPPAESRVVSKAGRESFGGAASVILAVFQMSRRKGHRFSAVDAGGGCSALKFSPEIPNPFRKGKRHGGGNVDRAPGNPSRRRLKAQLRLWTGRTEAENLALRSVRCPTSGPTHHHNILQKSIDLLSSVSTFFP